MKPTEVSIKQEDKLLYIYNDIKIAGPSKLKVDDVVRVFNYNDAADKSSDLPISGLA